MNRQNRRKSNFMVAEQNFNNKRHITTHGPMKNFSPLHTKISDVWSFSHILGLSGLDR